METNNSTPKPAGENDRPVAAITGASSGFGKIYADKLAARGMDLLLVARRENMLRELADELESKYNIVVETLPADLSIAGDLKRVEQRLESVSNLQFLVNSAGFGASQIFPYVNIETETNMVLVHCLATMRLCRAALVPMTAKKYGRIINIASAAGFLAGTGCADYCSTKAYLITFSKCLHCDVRRNNIRVQALCPGFVRTSFHDSATMQTSTIPQTVPWWLWISAEKVVKTSLKTIEKNWFYKVVCIPTVLYKLVAYFGSEWLVAPLRILFSRGTVR